MKSRLHFFLVLLVTVFLDGCSPALGAHSPIVDVIGSYFPAWMICILAGLVATIVVRALLIGLRLHTHLHPRGVVYPCMVLCFTLVTWLAFFQN